MIATSGNEIRSIRNLTLKGLGKKPYPQKEGGQIGFELSTVLVLEVEKLNSLEPTETSNQDEAFDNLSVSDSRTKAPERNDNLRKGNRPLDLVVKANV